MAIQRWRDEFLCWAGREGLSVSIARSLISKAKTLQRLAEAQCNGDWPADNGERETQECSKCATYWHPSVMRAPSEMSKTVPQAIFEGKIEILPNGKPGLPGTAGMKVNKVCPDCRAQAQTERLLLGTGLKANFQGDPRGCVLSVVLSDGREIGVPS